MAKPPVRRGPNKRPASRSSTKKPAAKTRTAYKKPAAAKPKAKTKAKQHKDEEPGKETNDKEDHDEEQHEEEQGGGTQYYSPKKADTSHSKAPKHVPKAKAKAKSKGTGVAEGGRKRMGLKALENPAPKRSRVSKSSGGKEASPPKRTFARRWEPATDPAKTWWNCLKDSYEKVVKHRVKSPSTLEEGKHHWGDSYFSYHGFAMFGFTLF